MSGIAHHRSSPGVRARRAWRDWRRSRPFWGGLLVLIGGVEILMTVWAPLGVVLHVGMQNFIGYLVPLVIIMLGLLIWFHPAQRIFYSLIAMVLALGSFLTSNMGGFILGLLFTVIGAALAFAWSDSVGEKSARERPDHSPERSADGRPDHSPERSADDRPDHSVGRSADDGSDHFLEGSGAETADLSGERPAGRRDTGVRSAE
ncbi:DUF6114 domain-containing protein [Actinoplanes siamensis]|uniref:Uncharacterized protein n=1 Tax=Actinoplanes siamensis TaxID=1223317 RepID=A0A919N960_9ACTN|nr:DUF6114 domain-containing protein [Actinoplanes siamensis]GIF06663.1 hypothetical protein Asi03nite_42010 [Actinoplanes siamensis]